LEAAEDGRSTKAEATGLALTTDESLFVDVVGCRQTRSVKQVEWASHKLKPQRKRILQNIE
jgi:hypothetical protein